VAAAVAATAAAPAFAAAADRNARAQHLFYIRSAATAPADAMDMWTIGSTKMQKWADERRGGMVPELGHTPNLDHIIKCVFAATDAVALRITQYVHHPPPCPPPPCAGSRRTAS